MPINEFIKSATFTPLDPSFMMRAKMVNEERAEKANTEFDSLFSEINKVKAVPQDIPLRNEKLKQYNDQLKSWTDRYADNPVQGMNELRNIKRTFNQDFTYGQLGDIHGKGLQYEALVKNYNEEAAKGTFKGLEDVAYYNMVQAPLSQYQQSQEVAPGVYNKISWGNARQYADLGEDFDKFAQQWAYDSGYGELKKDRYGYISNTKNDYVNPDEVIQGVMAYAYNNPKYAGQFKDMANYYQAQVNANTQVTPEGIPFVTGSDAKGNPVYMRPPSGEETLKQYIGGIGQALGMREGFVRESKDYRQDWMLKDAMDAARAEKPVAPPTSYTAPSFQGPAKNYWAAQKDLLKGTPSAFGASLQTAGTLGGPVGGAAARFLGNILPGGLTKQPSDVLTKEQQTHLASAESLFGKAPADPERKLKLLEQYYDYMEARQLNIQPQLPGTFDPLTKRVVTDYEAANKEADTKNLFYFGNEKNTKGTNIASNLLWKEVGGDNKEVTGQKLRDKHSSETFNWAGRLPVDNPYFPAGDLYNAVDDKGQIVGTYAVKSSDADVYSPLWQMYQSKSFGTAPLNIEGKEFTVTYERESAPTLDNQGRPIETGAGKAILKDSTGKVIATSDPMDPSKPETLDPVMNLYNKLRK